MGVTLERGRIRRRRRGLASEPSGAWAAAACAYAHNLFTVLRPVMHTSLAIECALLGELLRSVDTKLPSPEKLTAARMQTALRRYREAKPEPVAIPPFGGMVEANFGTVCAVAGLEDAEAAVLRFVVAADRHKPLAELTDLLGEISLAEAHLAVAAACGLGVESVRAVLNPRARLRGSGLIAAEGYSESITGRFAVKAGITDLLSLPRLDRETFVQAFLPEVAPTPLNAADFAEIAPAAEIALNTLVAALRGRVRGVNILVYGPTGTGKTTLAAILAREAGARLLQVGRENDDGLSASAEERLSSLRLGNQLLGGGEAILLFDEIEDLFQWAPRVMFGGPERAASGMSKQWFNLLLETNAVPTIWITNRAEGIDPAFLRRFTFAIELPAPGPQQRSRVLARHLTGGDAITPGDTTVIATRFAASPGQFATAVAAARLVGGGRATRAGVESFLEPIDKLVSGDTAARRGGHDPAAFALSGIRASQDLARLADRIAAAARGQGLSLLFHGLPGTGKSEFARHLAHRMGRPLTLRRCSDILSCWLGESEKQIAAAFREAGSEGAVLVFDEADSFLRRREGASHSWEVTQVNEFLQQLELFQGVVICTTNLLTELDPASIRRFVFKVEFQSAGPNEAESLFGALLRTWVEPAEHSRAVGEIRALASRCGVLTAGDFAAVARRFRAMATVVSATECAEALHGEVEHKRSRGAVGFGAAVRPQ